MKKSVVVLLHVGYWMMYILLLFLLITVIAIAEVPKMGQLAFFKFLPFFAGFAIIPGMICYYSFYTVLFTKFLSQKKILKFIVFGFAVSIVSALIGGIILAIPAYFKLGAGTFGGGIRIAVPLLIIMTINTLANGIVGTVLRGFITSYGDIKLKEDLNKKNYEMELALVKSQINPHFLFNTLNNIDVLIQKDAIKASVYLNKLSDIMRFMLYETKTERIELSKELTYIEKYIELQKIRTSNLNYVNYAVEGNTDGLLIAPMLFIPFIENAFKHAENKKMENAINIRIVIKHDRIEFKCENNYSDDNQINHDESGLGNELIQKRLELLYPKKHKLEITNSDNTYKVNLILL